MSSIFALINAQDVLKVKVAINIHKYKNKTHWYFSRRDKKDKL